MNISNISKIKVLDDTEDGRDVLGLVVQSADFILESQDESINNLEDFILDCKKSVDAIVSDHHLRRRTKYFPVDGAEFVSRCYKQHIPALLVTKFLSAEVSEIRKFRRHIPTILKPADYNEDTLVTALEKSMNEFNGKFEPDRKSWRTLIRIEEMGPSSSGNFYAIIPGWDSREAISLNLDIVPNEIRPLIVPDFRLFARVNIGADNPDEFFFFDWEV